MADVYTPPPDFAYLLVTPFSMPSDRGDRWAVSFTGNNAALVAAALSVVVTVSFLCLWNLIVFVAMFFRGNGLLQRYAALVTLWNSNDSWFAFTAMLSYTWQTWQGSKSGHHWPDFLYGLAFCLLALAVFGASIAMGIVAPSLVEIGNVAPVRPSALFYPAIPAADPAQRLQDFGLRAPSVMRALGSVEAAKVTLRSRVSVEIDQSYAPRDDGERIISLDYGYSLSGIDLGLQGGTDLKLAVEGHCVTEYGWLVEPDGGEYDEYKLWNDDRRAEFVLVNENDIMHAPTASFIPHADASKQLISNSNVSFAVLVHSAHRSSITAGGDPWYATEPRPVNATPAPFEAQFWMKRRRPALSCWEQAKWSYGEHTADSVFDLKTIPGIKVPEVLLNVLEATLGGGPMLVRLGNASGDSALRSRTTSPNGVINAGVSSMHDDMERLILASFVATRSIFTDATMFGQPDNYENVMVGANGEPRDGAGNFVVSSPNIQTFSLTGIVTLAAILLALLLANSAAKILVRFHHGRHGGGSPNNEMEKTGKSTLGNEEETSTNAGGDGNPAPEAKDAQPSPWALFHVLSAVQLFRCLYETDEDFTKCGWACDRVVPDEENKKRFLLHPPCKDRKCMGHVQKNSLEAARNNTA